MIFFISGKRLAKSGKVHQAHGAILHSVAALYNSTVSILSSPSSRSPLLDFIGKEIKGDVFGLDRARILYNLCKLSLQSCHSRFVILVNTNLIKCQFDNFTRHY